MAGVTNEMREKIKGFTKESCSDSEEDQLKSEFIHQFANGSAKLMMEADKAAIFRDMHPADKLTLFTQGLMITLAGFLLPAVRLGLLPEGTSVEAVVEQYLKMNVEVGVANAAHLEKEFLKPK